MLYQNRVDGSLYYWLMDAAGLTIRTSGYLASTPPAGWNVVGTPDLDGDGKADLLFQNASTGAMAAWLMNGTAIRAQGIDLLAPTARTEVGSPRLNADTFPDVLLQDNASASLTTLLLTWSGTTPAITNGSVSGTLSPTQKVVATADLDGDGKADVLFQDTNTGRLSYWLLNNSTVIATGVLPSFGDVSNWKVVGTPDLNRDGKADVLLQSASAPPRAKNPFGFVGKAGYYSDEESGLQLLGHRYYLPKLGRFLTQDPTGHDTGLNLYRYVGDNPLTGIDPLGLDDIYLEKAQMRWYQKHPNLPYGMDRFDIRKNSLSAQRMGASIESDVRENTSGEPTSFLDFFIGTENVDAGLILASKMFYFYNQVKNKAQWDYKQFGVQYEEIGNFNYGATGAAMGIDLNILLRAAGWAQRQAHTSKSEWGSPLDFNLLSSYGDDPQDQKWITRGFFWFQKGAVNPSR